VSASKASTLRTLTMPTGVKVLARLNVHRPDPTPKKGGTGRRSRQFALSFEYRDHMAQASTHVGGTVQSLAQLRDEHERKATPLQRFMARFTGRAASPGFVIFLTAIFIFWIGVNSALLFVGKKPVDEPPFFWMQGAVSLAALYMTVLILVT
jgi:uncharacterized membrane protein